MVFSNIDVEESDVEHRYIALNSLLIVVCLSCSIFCAYYLRHRGINFLPESSIAIIIGGIIGYLVRLICPTTLEKAFLLFRPEVFFFLLLPPIIFEAVYDIKKQEFFDNFWTICLYAVVGTVSSAVIIGFLVFAIGRTYIVSIDSSSPIEALLFGALISATDPVATLSIIGNSAFNCDPLLYTLVFGESIFNDAVAIVLFTTILQHNGSNFTWVSVFIILFEFVIISVGSMIVGGMVAFIGWCMFKYSKLKEFPMYELPILILFAFGSYALAEALRWSGIMSLFFYSMLTSHYNTGNLSSSSQSSAHQLFKSLATISETLVYLYIGFELFTGRFKRFNIGFLLCCIAFCLFARFVNTFSLTWIANVWRKVKVPFSMQGAIWFAGLRGPLAFALSQNMPIAHKDLYVSTTLCIVVLSTIICGGITEPFLKGLGLRRPPLTAIAQGEYGCTPSNDVNSEQIDGICAEVELTQIRTVVELNATE